MEPGSLADARFRFLNGGRCDDCLATIAVAAARTADSNRRRLGLRRVPSLPNRFYDWIRHRPARYTALLMLLIGPPSGKKLAPGLRGAKPGGLATRTRGLGVRV
jgi:hypothetical protein